MVHALLPRAFSKYIWDEMFAKHAREHKELRRWEDKPQRLEWTSSTETVRVLDISSKMASTTDEETAIH